MIKIGAVNIDTSHPRGFAAQFEKSDRAKYVAVYNDGFRERDEVEAFASKYNLTICETLEEMAELVDIAFIHGCNWDRHLEMAKVFINKGVKVFIDKPIVGNMKDLEEFKALAEDGSVEILGTSALRYCYEVQNVQKVLKENNVKPVHTCVTVGVDEFNYAIHAAEMICAIHTEKPKSCRHINTTNANGRVCNTFMVTFADGSTAEYICIDGRFSMFNTIVMTNGKNHETDLCFITDNTKLYEAMLDKLFNKLEGKKDELATAEQMCDAIKIMLAGKASQENGDIEVSLDSDLLYKTSYDGYEFEKGYAAAASKMYLD